MVKISEAELIKNILTKPNAPFIVQEISVQLEAERARRIAFYNEITEQQKAEFINGEVIIHSPVKKEHNDASMAVFRLISLYNSKHQLGYVGYEKVMIALTRNDYEPDVCFFKKEKSKDFKKGQTRFPAPDLVVEILSKGTSKIDRTIKFEDYQAHAVQEYWMIDPVKETIEQYRLDKKGKYELILKSTSGQLKCKAIKGFEVPIEAIFNEAENLSAIQEILKT